MSAVRRPSRGSVLWTIAAPILLDGILRALPDAPSYAGTAAAAFLLGALPLCSGLRGRKLPAALLEPVAGGLATVVGALLFGLVAGDVLPRVLDVVPGALLAPLGVGHVPVHATLLLVVGVVALVGDGTAGRLRTLVGVEWLKMRRGRLLRVGLGLAAATTLLVSVTHVPVKEETTGWTQAAGSLGVGFWTAEILLFVLGATSVAGEVSQGTMKMILPHAYRRAEWISAKALVLLFAALLFAVVVAAVGVGHTLADTGLGDVTREAPAGFGQEDTVEVFESASVMGGRLLQTAAVSAASLAASALVGLLLSCVFTGLVPALSAAFLVFAALKTGKAFLGLSPRALQSIYAYYPDELRRLTEQFGRAVNDSWDATLAGQGLHLALLTGTLGLLVSLRLFGRRDLHG